MATQKLGVRLIEQLAPGSKPYEVRDSEITGLLLRIQPTGVMTYYCEYRNKHGQKHRVKIGPAKILSVAQARDKSRQIIGEVALGMDPAQEAKRRKVGSLEDFLDGQYKLWAEGHLKSWASTIQSLKSRFSTLLSSRLDDITRWQVEKWILERKKTGTNGATINRNIGMLKAALSRAVEWGLLESHPLKGIKNQRIDSRGKIRFLTEDEENRLFLALDAREKEIIKGRESGNMWRIVRNYKLLPTYKDNFFADYLKPMVTLSLNTGLRRGELFALTWDDIDFNHKQLTVTGKTAKSGQTRHIPLNKVALHTLSMWKYQSAEKLVFANPQGKAFTTLKKSWCNLLTRSQIKYFRWHDMRHSFASKLVMAGVDLNTIRELLGHADIKMTLRYAHLAPKVKAEAVERLLSPANCINEMKYETEEESKTRFS